jgi:hypothetical protein
VTVVVVTEVVEVPLMSKMKDAPNFKFHIFQNNNLLVVVVLVVLVVDVVVATKFKDEISSSCCLIYQ